MKAEFETNLDPYFEVEWLDSEGDGHHVTFSKDDSTLKDFITAIEPLCASVGVYRVWKERL